MPDDRLDILGLGCVAVDDLLYVPAYPPPDAKTRVSRRERHCGGLTATALVAAARLGSRCAYAATLGPDDLSAFALGRLRAEGIDTASVPLDPAAGPIYSVIVVDETHRTRNVFSDRAAFLAGKPPKLDAQTVRRARVLFVDHVRPDAELDAARIARESNIPIVADFERGDAPGFAALWALVNHLVVSRDFATKTTGAPDPASACLALRQPHHQAVVVTAGADGCYFLDAAMDCAGHAPAFRVEAVDTTGCGDVFHGAYAHGLAHQLPLPERVRRAGAAAALKATRPGGQAGIPTAAELDRFLKAQVHPSTGI